MELIGKYELHEELAAGGMATVFLGRRISDDFLSPCVAIKRIQEHLARDEEVVTLLLEEARISTLIRHPNVVATLDVESSGRELLLVMEYVHGVTLAELLRTCARTKTPVPVQIAASIFHGVLLGLHAAHETTDAAGVPLRVVHRDVSPQNIIVGADGIARLLDFGIAKTIGSVTHTQTGLVRGKVAYMAPEILHFQPATRQTDIWATAVVLWETLTARRLFTGEDLTIWGKILTAELVAPGALLGEHNPLDAVVMRGLARETTERFASAAEMATAIVEAIPLAPPIEVAAWVTSLAGRTLSERANLLGAVGSRPRTSHAPPGSQTPLGSHGVAPMGMGLGVALRPASDPALPDHARAHAPSPVTAARWWPWIISALLAIIVLLLVVLLVARRGSREDRPAASTAGPAAAAVTSASAPAEASPPSLVAAGSASGASSAVAVATASAASSEGATTKKPRGGPAGPHRTPPTAASPSVPPLPKPANTCDPPYSIDEGGRKVFKLDCVKGN